MSSTVPGACLCGAVRFEVSLPPRFVSHCHCSQCRRAHGAAFVTWAGFRAEEVRFTAGEAGVVSFSTETGGERRFCGTCGSTLTFASPRWAGELHVALAHLLGDVGMAPAGHVYVDHKAPWFPIEDDLPQYGGETGVEPKGEA